MGCLRPTLAFLLVSTFIRLTPMCRKRAIFSAPSTRYICQLSSRIAVSRSQCSLLSIPQCRFTKLHWRQQCWANAIAVFQWLLLAIMLLVHCHARFFKPAQPGYTLAMSVASSTWYWRASTRPCPCSIYRRVAVFTDVNACLMLSYNRCLLPLTAIR